MCVCMSVGKCVYKECRVMCLCEIVGYECVCGGECGVCVSVGWLCMSVSNSGCV